MVHMGKSIFNGAEHQTYATDVLLRPIGFTAISNEVDTKVFILTIGC